LATKANARESFEVQLRAFLAAVFEFFDSRRTFKKICFEADNQARYAKVGDAKPAAQQLQERCQRIIKVGLKEKVLKEDGADTYAIVLASIVRGLLMARIDDPRPLAAEVDHVVEIFLRGVGHGAKR
jgi:hypothetical protein